MSLIKTSFPNWPNLTDFFDDDWVKFKFNQGNVLPAINIIENELNYEIELAAPGFKKKDFHVVVENGVLTITGEAKNEVEEKDKNFTRMEFSMKSFTKSFTLPENVKNEEIEAKYEDGILRMFLQKTALKLPPKKEVMIK